MLRLPSTALLLVLFIPGTLIAQPLEPAPAAPPSDAAKAPAEAPQAAVPPAATQAAVPPAEEKKTEKDLALEKARAIYAKRAKLSQHKKAYRAIKALAKKYGDDRDLQLWCARTAYYCAHRIDDSDKRAKTARSARRLLKKSPKDYDGRLWMALNKFKYQLAESFILPSKDEIRQIMGYLDKMIRDEPKRPEAYMLLGAMLRDLPGWPISIGDEDRGLELLVKGARYAGKDAEYLLELAAGYASAGRTAEARKTYKTCINEGTGRPDLEWERDDARNYAKKMLKELD